MSNYDDALVKELRECASELTKIANSEVNLEKMASVDGAPASSSRHDYLTGVLEGLGIH